MELAGLCQMNRLSEIVNLEKAAGFFAGNGGKNWGVDEREAVIIEKSSYRIDDGMADFGDAPGYLAAKVQMAVF